MYVSSISPLTKTKPKFPFRHIVRLVEFIDAKGIDILCIWSMETFDVTIDHILVHFIGSKLGLYVSFRIPLYLQKANAMSVPVKPIPEMWIPCIKNIVIHSNTINSLHICLRFFIP